MNEDTISPATGSESVDFLQQSKGHAIQAADELKTAATLKAQQLREAAGANAARLKESAIDTTRRLRESAEVQAQRAREIATQQWDSARTHARDWQGQGESLIRENPTQAVLTALGVGFLLGLVFRR